MKSWFNRALVLALLIALLAGAVAACGKAPVPVSDGKLDVVVSIVPQKYFVERIGGERVNVSVMVEPGASPATYEPKPEQLKALSSAAAYFSIGVPFENAWLGRIAAANEKMKMVDTIAGIERLPMTAPDPDDDRAVGAPDPHVWVSPRLVKIQSQTIYESLVQLDPDHEPEYRANLDAFMADIDRLEADLKEALSGLKNPKFMVFHPSWGYLADEFGLEQIAIEVGGQEPSAQELAHLIQVAREEEIRVVFAQPEFSTVDAETIAQEIGGEVLLISPLAPDWLDNMRQVAQTFAEVMNR
jgi:zinc transport system substrate-binding protein